MKQTTKRVRPLAFHGYPGVFEIAGMYAPRDAGIGYWLAQQEFHDIVQDAIVSTPIQITVGDDKAWLVSQLTAEKIMDRVDAARRLKPIIGAEQVLAGLEKGYPPANPHDMMLLVNCMAELGDLSHVAEVVDMYDAGGYADFWNVRNGSNPPWKQYGGDMLVFLLRWGEERGLRHVTQYLIDHKDAPPEAYDPKWSLMKALTRGYYGRSEMQFDRRVLPLLILLLDEDNRAGRPPSQANGARWCDSAALAIQKLLDRDWHLSLDLIEDARDAIIAQMRTDLSP